MIVPFYYIRQVWVQEKVLSVKLMVYWLGEHAALRLGTLLAHSLVILLDDL